MNRKIELGIMMIWLTTLVACTHTSHRLPPQLTHPKSPMDSHMAEIVNWVESQKPVHLLEVRADGAGRSEKGWVMMDTLSDGRVRMTEVYNVYRDQSGGTEYYVQELKLDLTDFENRQEAIDYQFKVTPDTAFMVLADPYEVQIDRKMTLPVDTDSMEIYRILGFAHLGDPKPGHHKYWSPILGNVVIWYGSETLELVKHPALMKAKDLEALRSAIRARMNQDTSQS
ncbi:hypothetical protein [Pontibacter sp. G13]|uniref:hypothetical protein n=1 Tax=Pontibacter sp. G13 TaxID=3074898 RepID=UPI0028895F59|nr:hypothetical protein [Pontibacter sp. G13]WNJ19790.1 hypothetical protein RJD25_04845 [Pontibacter sp. G13]